MSGIFANTSCLFTYHKEKYIDYKARTIKKRFADGLVQTKIFHCRLFVQIIVAKCCSNIGHEMCILVLVFPMSTENFLTA